VARVSEWLRKDLALAGALLTTKATDIENQAIGCLSAAKIISLLSALLQSRVFDHSFSLRARIQNEQSIKY
jgi:hypothetical protein